MQNTIQIPITDEALEKILLRHLVIEGCIGEKEQALFQGLERRGKNTFVKFEVKQIINNEDK